MKILYFHQYFKTPEEGGAIRSYYIARALVEAGHEVVMVTTHNQAQAAQVEIAGIVVHYLPVAYDNTMGTGSRMKAFLKYVRLAIWEAIRVPDIDVCYVTSTPLTVGLIGLFLKRWRGIPYIFEVRDLWPEAPIQLGVIRSSWQKSLLHRLERRIYRKADQLIALSPGMKAGMLEKVPDKHIHMIPNMADCEFFRPEPVRPEMLRKYGWDDVFRIIYFGTIGKANHLDPLLELAPLFSQKEIHIVIVGEGAEKGRFQAHSMDLPQVSWMDPVDKETIRDLLSISHAAYISFADIPILQTNSPNKLFDALAAGKMILVNVKGWMKDLVEENNCGFYADPHSPEAVTKQLFGYMNDPRQLIRYQQNARRLAMERFDRKVLCQQVIECLEAGGY